MFYQVEIIVKNVCLGMLLFEYVLFIFETEGILLPPKHWNSRCDLPHLAILLLISNPWSCRLSSLSLWNEFIM